ncbi:hypothetical protein BN2475_160029 [Paraburkholderia ribeironis]|uniref:Uncharacterized protein n=1 Tax=Paraburkholderia ribeironis TaxID=1247936 RepID=A0A1N7RU95_9BURK|nr:hypothetical protein BN2475_160029 [Paraburkholderia ribeironis]
MRNQCHVSTYVKRQEDFKVCSWGKLSVVIPTGNHTLSELQEQATCRAKLILDLLRETALQPPDLTGSSSDAALDIWKKLGS